MVLINIEALSTTELQYIAQQEGMDNWDSLEREELIEALEELYEDQEEDIPVPGGNSQRINRRRYINTLTDFRGGAEIISNLPGVEALPSAYAETSIHVLLREPGWAYAYWNVSPLILEKLSDESETSLEFFLTVDILDGATGQKIESFDIEVAPEDREWNINIPSLQHSYITKLMCRSSVGDNELCRSQAIEMSAPWWSTGSPTASIDNRMFELNFRPLISRSGVLIDNRSIADKISNLVQTSLENAK